MNKRIVNIPPRAVRPANRMPLTFNTAAPAAGESEDPLRQIALDIARFDPLLADFLIRSGDHRLNQ